MCCTDMGRSVQGPFQATPWVGFNPSDCGCGCIGKEQAVLRLTHYQEHLKAELKSVERQINALQEPEK